jgi:hypothetical protein
VLVNTQHQKDFDIKIEGSNIDTYVMAVDFPFKTTSKGNSNKYHGKAKENAIFLYVGTTESVARSATLSYS